MAVGSCQAPCRVPWATQRKRPTFDSGAIVPAQSVEIAPAIGTPSRPHGRQGRLAPPDRWPKYLSLPCDPIHAERFAEISLRRGSAYERASGCLGAARKNRCKTRHETGNVTRMLGSPSRNLLKRLAPQAGFEPATLRLTAGCQSSCCVLPGVATCCCLLLKRFHLWTLRVAACCL